ncbi:hypothetical protein RF11_01054 [Thelohanellus kitauei]|uniref:Uncharacterized protein n=1 Tax=Thelohanellus kitauei TaxID=669202 RepID=A0A0C2IJB1_THEKT|nr:hypothetical protein RF11_01054 [Thelohanellus kitauei]
MIIEEGFIRGIFWECDQHLTKTFNNQTPEIFQNSNYKRCKQVLMKIVLLFNESNYLDNHSARLLMRWWDDSIHTYNFHGFSENNRNVSDGNLASIIPETTNYGIPIEGSLSWFTLIYEKKFVFGDIKSKLKKLEFYLIYFP